MPNQKKRYVRISFRVELFRWGVADPHGFSSILYDSKYGKIAVFGVKSSQKPCRNCNCIPKSGQCFLKRYFNNITMFTIIFLSNRKSWTCPTSVFTKAGPPIIRNNGSNERRFRRTVYFTFRPHRP